MCVEVIKRIHQAYKNAVPLKIRINIQLSFISEQLKWKLIKKRLLNWEKIPQKSLFHS